MSKSTRNPSSLIREAKFRTAKFSMCLDEDLIEQYDALRAQRDAAMAERADSLAGPRAPEFDEPLGQLREQIDEATLTLTFTALARPRFRELCDKFPPSRDENGVINVTEDIIGVHFDDFMAAIIPMSIVDPELASEDIRTLVEERMTDRQYQEMTDVIWDLNRGKVNIPFS